MKAILDVLFRAREWLDANRDQQWEEGSAYPLVDDLTQAINDAYLGGALDLHRPTKAIPSSVADPERERMRRAAREVRYLDRWSDAIRQGHSNGITDPKTLERTASIISSLMEEVGKLRKENGDLSRSIELAPSPDSNRPFQQLEDAARDLNNRIMGAIEEDRRQAERRRSVRKS
jgi:hypothetical protein